MKLRGVIIVVLAALLIYGFVKGYPLLRGPELLIESPIEGGTSTDGFIMVRGTALRTESLTLNGGPLLIDEKGHFSKELLLPKGGATISLTAHDRFGREVTEKRDIFVP